ncbi:uncharacterized protein LOC111369048 [Olea europaea var. sylvestris]|uniref:uncharacterized protein LOC111369048 n=1 Tax=Olea europaea var. sylvestris TaxID=158386 RepID=UPI000C1D2A79|nr:uncharacterized protein LOC111369048 [Olea europaea var. sylvestris]
MHCKKDASYKKNAFLTKQVCAVIKQRISPKYKDHGCPTISCVIGNRESAQAFLDLGASVNLMPYAIYSLLGLGEMKPTSPIDFLVLDAKVEVDVNSNLPIILGRPFLVTTNALINCKNDLMRLTFGNMTLEVNIFHVTKRPMEDDECHQTYIIDAFTQEEASTTIDIDPSNSFLLNFETSYGFDVDDYANVCVVFAKLQDCRTSPWQPKFEALLERIGGKKPSSIESPRPELKQLPTGLKHVFLGLGNTFPVIIL